MVKKKKAPSAWGVGGRPGKKGSKARKYKESVKRATGMVDQAPVARLSSNFQAPSDRILKPLRENIFKKAKAPVKVIINCMLSPGDVIMLTGAIRDLHMSHPGKFITDVRTSCPPVFEANPYITPIEDTDKDAFFINAEYPLVHKSNSGLYHFIHGYRQDIQSKLGVNIESTVQKGDIHISDEEKSWNSQIHEITQKNLPFWIVNAGMKLDFTCKLWEVQRYQQVVDAMPDVTFVQVGGKEHVHTHLRNNGNLINLVGHTDMRQFIRLVYWSSGCLSPVSMLMHLAAAIPVNPMYDRAERPCVVVAGGREPSTWESYSWQQYLHTCGMLPCCDHGGCWASRVKPIGDGDEKDHNNLCAMPVNTESNQIIPKCMDMITVDEVVGKIRGYLEHYDYSDSDSSKWCRIDDPKAIVKT